MAYIEFKNFLLIIPVLSLLVCCIFCPITTQAAGLYSKYSVLIDADSGRILSGSNETTAVSMASTTKIMTLIIALENCDKNFVATTSAYAASMPDVQLNAVTGEQFIINDLYYSLMLESHNDSAVIIAENTAYYLLCKNPSLRSETPFVILIWWPATCKQGNTQCPVFVFVCTYIAVSGFVSETCFSRDNSFIRI
jgi:serine-type D-Ala-D-Ala carboxypeptidase (penicillin-binding protein 5/6)